MTIIKQPGQIGAGQVSDALFQTSDLMPTMLDLCGVEIPAGLDGSSQKAVCYGNSDAIHDAIFAVNATGRMLRFGDYKYVRSEIYDETFEILLNLAEDPTEANNLVDDPASAAVLQTARQQMDAWLAQEGLKVAFDPI